MDALKNCAACLENILSRKRLNQTMRYVMQIISSAVSGKY